MRCGARSDLRRFPAPDALTCPHNRTLAQVEIGTRFEAVDRATQERLIIRGCAISDAGVRIWLHRALPPAADLPFPASKAESATEPGTTRIHRGSRTYPDGSR